MRKILNKIGIKTRLDLIFLCGTIFVSSFLVVFKLFPDKFNIDWTKNKREINKDMSFFVDKDGNFLPKKEGKHRYFKSLGKTDEQISADEIATYYLRSAWIVPQFLPVIFNSTAIGGSYNAALFSTYTITSVVKKVVHKKRPDGGNYKSFPSGHTSGTAVLGGFLHKFTNIKIATPFYIASIVTGGSRIFSNRHDIYDVAAGFLVGAFCGFYTNSLIIYFVGVFAKRFRFIRSIVDFLLCKF